ncbi:MAG: RNA methyltransferase [Ignavibacteriae bacterium]|nr:MAG: RNA methyltransferase [Ignavibacteriota bacterium]
MFTTVAITSLNHPDLTPYRTLRQSVEQFRNGKFIAEGTMVVERLLESTHTIVSVLITPEWLEEYRDRIGSRREHITVFVGKKELLNTIVGYNLHQSIMALGKIPAQETLASVLNQSLPPHLFVAIEGLANAENIGVLVRNCTAFGVHAILVGETSSSPYLRRAVRNSMGTVFKMPVVHCTNLVETLKTLQQSHQCSVVAAHPHTEEHHIHHIDFSGNCCLVFGSEGHGVSPEVLSACDMPVAIPMQHGVDSLNVASASAVFLYEVMRQRTRTI